MRHFFIEPGELKKDHPTISGADANHVIHVLRMGIGDEIALVDGSGDVFQASIQGLEKGRVSVAVIGRQAAQTESTLHITVAQAFLKDKKMDSLVRPMTELGVYRWIPFIAERSVARPPAYKAGARQDRWCKLAKEAVKQCRRARWMEIEAICSFNDVLDKATTYGTRIMFWENATMRLREVIAGQSGSNGRNAMILIGPEGGFSTPEVDKARAHGFVDVWLGPRILKAETASLTACALMQHLLGDLG